MRATLQKADERRKGRAAFLAEWPESDAATHKIVAQHMIAGHLGGMSSNKLLLEAIALRKCVTAIYNRGTVKLAPHILYTRHDELFIDAVTVSRDGKPPREIKIGTFKLAGLNDLALDDAFFEPEPGFDAADEKYAGVALFAVQR